MNGSVIRWLQAAKTRSDSPGTAAGNAVWKGHEIGLPSGHKVVVGILKTCGLNVANLLKPLPCGRRIDYSYLFIVGAVSLPLD